MAKGNDGKLSDEYLRKVAKALDAPAERGEEALIDGGDFSVDVPIAPGKPLAVQIAEDVERKYGGGQAGLAAKGGQAGLAADLAKRAAVKPPIGTPIVGAPLVAGPLVGGALASEVAKGRGGMRLLEPIGPLMEPIGTLAESVGGLAELRSMEEAVMGGPEARALRDAASHPLFLSVREIEKQLAIASRDSIRQSRRQDAARRYPIGHPARKRAEEGTSHPAPNLAAVYGEMAAEAVRLTEEQRNKHAKVIAERDDALRKHEKAQAEIEALKASLDAPQVKTIEHARLDAEVLMRKEDRLSAERIATMSAESNLKIVQVQQASLREIETLKAANAKELEAERSNTAKALEAERSKTATAVEAERGKIAKAVEDMKSKTTTRVAWIGVPSGALCGAIVTGVVTWLLRSSAPAAPLPMAAAVSAGEAPVSAPVPNASASTWAPPLGR